MNGIYFATFTTRVYNIEIRVQGRETGARIRDCDRAAQRVAIMVPVNIAKLFPSTVWIATTFWI